MAAIAHGYSEQTTVQTHTGNTSWTTKHTVAASNFTAGGVYLILCTAQVGGNNTSNNFGFRLAHGTTPTSFTETEMVMQPQATAATALSDYSVATVFTQPGTAEDIVFQVQCATNSANIVRADTISIAWIRLDASLSTPADYIYDTDTTATTHTTSFQDFASITFTAGASEDWLIIASAQFSVNILTNQVQYRINRDSGTELQPSWGYEAEDNDETHTHLLFRAYTLSSGSHTFTVQGRDDASAGNAHAKSFIIGIRMAAFKDHGYFWNAAATTVSSSSFATEAGNVDITPTTAADFLILAQAMGDPNAVNVAFQQRIQIGGTTEPTGSESNDNIRSNDTTNDTAIPMAAMTMESFSTSAQDIDYDVYAAGSSGMDVLNRSVIALSMELAPSGPTGTAAITLNAPTVSATGTETITGTAAPTLPSAQVTASGTVVVPVTGTADVTLSAPVVSATGAETITGTAAVTLNAPTVAATGTETITGSSSVTLSAPSVAAQGLETVTGAAASTLPAATVDASGTVVAPITGTSDIVLNPVTLTASGVETIAGSAAVTVPSVTVAATGTAVSGVSGAADVTLTAVTVAATGTETITGTAAVTLNAPVVDATGTSLVAVTGTSAVVLSAPSVAATGAETLTGTATVTLSAPTVGASGVQSMGGSAALLLPAVVLAAIGEVVGPAPTTVFSPELLPGAAFRAARPPSGVAR